MLRTSSITFAFALWTVAAFATPITYSMLLEIDAVDPSSDPVFQVGNQYSGFFAVDDALLASDGTNLPATVYAFSLSIEDYSWIWSLPDPHSDFEGFRGPGGLGAQSPGFDVVNGEIVNLHGGVYGSGDVPFVDFSSDWIPSNRFHALLEGFERPFGLFQGTLSILPVAVPEPATVLVVLLGLGLLALRSGLKRRRWFR